MGYRLGLDVGTTFSAAAIARDGTVEIVSLGHHAAAIPTLLFLREDGVFLVGDAAARRGLDEPGRLARQFKRRFGDPIPLLLGGTPFSADALMSQVLRYLYTSVTQQEGTAPDAIAVTYPANWGPFKTDLLRQALHSAELDEAVLVTEPEAAAIYYATRERIDAGEVVAIYDLGGGTFDATVLRKTGQGYELLGEPEGIERLGGIDFDAAVLAHVSGFVGPSLAELGDDPAGLKATDRLRAEIVEAKEALSLDTEVSIPVMLPSLQTEIRLTRAEFEAMIRPTLSETTAALVRAIRSSGLETGDVKAVLLVGGSSRIPLVGQLVSSEIGRPVAIDVHPKHAVALGAALATGDPLDQPVARTGDTATAVPDAPVGARAKAPVRPVVPPSPADPVLVTAGAVGGNAAGADLPGAPAPVPSPRSPLRRPRVIASIGAAVVLLAAAVAFLAFNGKKQAPSAAVAHPEVPTFNIQLSVASIAVGDGSLWLGATSGPTVSRFDLGSRQITGTVRLGNFGGNTSVAFGAGAVWATNEEATAVSRIDPATNSIMASYPVGRQPHSVLVAAGAVWVTAPPDGVVMRIDPASGATTAIHIRGQPLNLAYGAGTVWVTDPGNNDVARIDPATNIVRSDAKSGGCPDFVVADDTAVWVQDECKVSTVFKIDPTTGNISGTVQVGRDAKGLALAAGSLWVANCSDATVSQVDLTKQASVRAVHVGNCGFAVAAEGNNLWVSNTGDSTLSVIRG